MTQAARCRVYKFGGASIQDAGAIRRRVSRHLADPVMSPQTAASHSNRLTAIPVPFSSLA